jgi:hypothetical protein
MYIKDHYKTLALEPSATMQEIKAAYRKLALQYHPDKNNDDPYALANFNEIKEAYETLTNPVKKDNYLQQRWYNRTTGNQQTQEVITPVNILKQSIDFEKYTSMLDVFRMDKEWLYDYMNALLSDNCINQLQQFNEPAILQQICITLLKPIRLLNSTQALTLTNKLLLLTAGDMQSQTLISTTVQQIKQKEKWQRNKWLIVLVTTIAICLLIKLAAD